MARSSFGGSGDYSSLFGSLYAQSKALKAQQQDALDKDAYDRWKNGLASDDEWLAYIASRADATKSDKDPTDHQRWIQLQRQYVTSIADSQAEFAYSEGKASINELVAYYQGRLARLQEDSEEYRQLKGHLSDLIDKRDSEDLSTGAQAISDRIDRGQATYEDLLKFYKDRLGGLRAGSDLAKQVTGEIEKVRGTIADTKLAGEFERLKYLYESRKLSGKSYAARLTVMAEQYKASDPQKYYQILEAANRVRTSGGSGGGGGGGGSFSRSEKGIEDQLKGIDNYLEMFSVAYKAGARVIPDPAKPGQQIVLTPELMSQIDEQRLGNFDKLASLYKANNLNSKYTTVLENKTKYIVSYVQPHNTVESSKQWGQLVGAAVKTIQATADSPDLEGSLKQVVTSFQTMQQWLQGEVVKNGALVAAEDQPTGDFVTNSSAFVDQALSILGDPEMDSTARMAALDALGRSLDSDAGADYDKGTQSAMKDLLTNSGAIASGAYDLASGKKVLAITPEKGLAPVDARIQHTLAADPATGAMVNVDLSVPDIAVANGERIQEVWIDVGGTPTKVYAVAGQAPSPYKAWVAKSAITIGGKTYKAGVAIPSNVVGQRGFAEAVQSGALSREDAFAVAGSPLNYIQIPAYDDNGTRHEAVTWYQDPQTKLWYKGQPPISSASLNDDGTVRVGEDGKLSVNWLPYANAAGVAVPYAGANGRAMQDLYDQGAVGTDPRYNQPTGMRDFSGNYTTDPNNSVAGGPMYFDPHDESNRASAYARIGPAAERSAIQEKIAAAKAFAAKSFGGGAGPAAPDASFQKQIADLAVNLGIRGMGAQGAARAASEPSIPAPSASILAARAGSIAKLQAVPKIQNADFAIPKTPISSGPALADLPAMRGTAIDASKILAAPVAPPKPAADTSTAKLPDLTRVTSGQYAGKVIPL